MRVFQIRPVYDLNNWNSVFMELNNSHYKSEEQYQQIKMQFIGGLLGRNVHCILQHPFRWKRHPFKW